MRLPQAGDLVRLLRLGSNEAYESLLGMVVGYETKGPMRGRARVIWISVSHGGAPAGDILCYSPSRLQVVNESR